MYWTRSNNVSFNSFLWGSLCLGLLISGSIPIANKINEIQPSPYMDEVFHVPQSLAYYQGNYSQWDDKITTLPGLYCFANIVLKGAQMVGIIRPELDHGNQPANFGYGYGPSTSAYRSVNILINALNFWCIFILLGFREETTTLTDAKRAFATLTLSLFPVHYFFSFLYYTDPLSTFLILHMIICAKMNCNKLAALSGFCAIFTRQNNIIWVVWNCTSTVWEVCKDYIPAIEEKIKNLFPIPLEGADNTGNQRTTNSKRKRSRAGIPSRSSLKDLLQIWIFCGRKALRQLYAHAIVLFIFLLFIVVNGSIVVGDKSAHKATLNLPQFFYFAAFFGCLTFGSVLLNLRRLLIAIRDNFKLFVFLVVVGVFIVKLNSPAHPYLLADNRHYTFYIWKRVYSSVQFPYSTFKFCLVPFYISVFFHICMDSLQHPALTFCTLSFIFLALIPQLLLEFRYFILPYFILRFSSGSLTWRSLIPECIAYLVINYATIQLFLHKPFSWSHAPAETQRFMW